MAPDEAEAEWRPKFGKLMPSMFVTLDVSRLSGWLNAVAPCRVKEGSI